MSTQEPAVPTPPRAIASISRPRTRRAAVPALLALLLLAACDGASVLGSDLAVDGLSEESVAPGLVQSVSLRRAALLGGNDVEVRSVITNTAAAPVTLVSRICGLDYSGSLELVEVPGVLRCAAYSSTVVLAAGDSVVATDHMRVASAPGTYVLRVRHALVPEFWATLPVTIRP